jgi:hypothetical protein
VALCEGPITGIGRIWADGKPLDMTGVTWRWYPGDEAQLPDPFIAGEDGRGQHARLSRHGLCRLRGTAASRFGNRLPQLSFEVFRPRRSRHGRGAGAAVTMIPASGEFTYATAIRKDGPARLRRDHHRAENLNALPDTADIVVALDRLQAMAPAVESVSLVVAWFGTDLRAGNCQDRPGRRGGGQDHDARGSGR